MTSPKSGTSGTPNTFDGPVEEKEVEEDDEADASKVEFPHSLDLEHGLQVEKDKVEISLGDSPV